MTENVWVLTDPERLLAGAVAAVLVAGASSATALQPAQRAKPAASVPASPAVVVSLPPATRRLAPKPVRKHKAARHAAPGPVPPEPPRAGCPAPRHPNAKPYVPKPLPAPTVAEAALPAALVAGPKATSLAALSGKGIWVTNFKQTRVDVPALIAKARRGGLTSIWVRTGGRQGYYGGQFLPALVPAAHAAGLKVVGWDFPFLSDPVADAGRARRALQDGVDAFAPDIETAAEGTHDTARRVSLYLSLVRAYAAGRPIAATVPRPTPKRLTSFPYGAFGRYADVFAPMVYWSCNEPGALVTQSLQRLGRWLPVAPVGQAYDMYDEGGRLGLPTRAETWRFLDVARRGGAIGASLWTIESIGAGQFNALTAYPWYRGRTQRR